MPAPGFLHLPGPCRSHRRRRRRLLDPSPDRLDRAGAPGGSGLAAVQLGRALGARVIAVVGDDKRAAFCRELGAETTVDHRRGGLADTLRAITDGHGVDAVYDPVGGRLAEESATALARGGRLLAVGFASGSWPELA